MNDIRGILFDLDGTLTLPGALDFPSIKRELGCPPGEPILEYLETQPPGRRERLERILEEREVEAARNSVPNVGAGTCLNVFRERGIPMGILTRNSLASVRTALEGFPGITLEYFTTIITREDSSPKPKPDGVLKAARCMGLPPKKLLVVGDFRLDVMAGKAAGALTAFLTNNGRSSLQPHDPEPDWLIHRLVELLDFFP